MCVLESWLSSPSSVISPVGIPLPSFSIQGSHPITLRGVVGEGEGLSFPRHRVYRRCLPFIIIALLFFLILVLTIALISSCRPPSTGRIRFYFCHWQGRSSFSLCLRLGSFPLPTVRCSFCSSQLSHAPPFPESNISPRHSAFRLFRSLTSSQFDQHLLIVRIPLRVSRLEPFVFLSLHLHGAIE